MRVSSHLAVEQAIARLATQSTQIAVYQDQISSGLRVSRPSQDPAAYVEIRSGQNQVFRLDAFRSNVAQAETTLNAGVESLQSINAILTRAAEIASEGANASTDDAGYAALANEVDGLIDRLIDVANSQQDGRYLFSGTATDTPPFLVTAKDASGRPLQVAYQGAPERARTLVGPDQALDTSYTGDEVFQQPGLDVFQSLMGLRDDLRNTSLDLSSRALAVSQRLGQVQQAADAVRQTIGEQATTLESLQALTNRYGDLKHATQTRTSDLESADIAEAVIRLSEQQNLFQSTLGVTARLFNSTLLDFIQ